MAKDIQEDTTETEDEKKSQDSKRKTDKDDDDPEETVTMKKSELVSLMDQRVTQALSTQKGKLSVEQEKKSEEQARDKLVADGKFKELVVKHEETIAKLNAAAEDRLFLETATTKLNELEMGSFAEILLAPAEKDLSKLELRATKLKALVEDAAEDLIQDKLETGTRVTKKGKKDRQGKTGGKNAKNMSDEEKLDYIEEHGASNWQKKLDQDYAPDET